MKRNNGLWITLGIVLGCTLLFVSIIGAQPGHVHSPHQFSKQTPYGLKPWMGPPHRVFFGKPPRGIIWKVLALSEDQKAQMREQFREFLINSAEKWHESQIVQQDFLVEMRKGLTQILTPEQLEKLQEHRATARIFYKLRAELRNLVLVPEAPNFRTLPQFQTAIAEKNATLEHERPAMVAQEIATISPKQHLQQFQILRL